MFCATRTLFNDAGQPLLINFDKHLMTFIISCILKLHVNHKTIFYFLLAYWIVDFLAPLLDFALHH